MSAQQLITEHIDLWTSSIKARNTQGRGSSKKRELYGIKKLRELILELAVCGKLVPQDPNDEPSRVLLERIAAEKAGLVKDKKIKKPKKLTDIAEIEKPFEIPLIWSWAYLSDLGVVASSSRVNKKDWQDQGIPFYRAREIVKLSRDGNVENELFISEELLQDLSKKGGLIPEKDDVMITGVGTIGVPYIVKETDHFYFKDASVLIFKNLFSLYPPYLYQFMKSPYWNKTIHEGSMGTTVHTFTIVRANSVVIPFPPLEEQHRIVAKVDELMALCDQLEQQTESSLDAHNLLVDTLLTTLTDARDANELSDNWARLAEHFDTLITTDYAVEQLKQIILQLAVMGKLVPQDPSDEPASELLKRIAAEKEQLIKDKKIKKQKPLSPITDEEKLFELPEGWELVALSHLGVFSGGKTPSKNNSAYWGGRIPWVTPKDMKVEKIVVAQDKVTQLAIDDGLAMVSIDSLLFVARSGILRRSFPVALAKVDCTVNQDLKVLALFNSNLADYILVMMKGFEEYILKNLIKIGTTVESLRFEDFSKHHFLLPPLEEQHRIVAKVNELMVLCDQLKTRLNDAQTIQFHLADAVVEQALC